MLDSIRKTFLGLAAALALVTTVAPTVSNAAVTSFFDNTFGGTLDANENLGLIDLDDGAFTFSGITGASSGGLNFSVMSSSLAPTASGAMQILIEAAGSSAISFTNLSFGGVNLVLQPIIGGFAAYFSAAVPADFVFNFTNANRSDSIQISLAAVPLPAGGLLLIGALGGLAAMRRRKAA